MKKILVSTFCVWNSYGSILQSLGLQKALCKLNVDAALIKNELPPKDYKTDTKDLPKPKNILKKILQFLTHKKNVKIYKKNCEFIKKNIKIEYFGNELEKNPDLAVADVFIAGSDQIWNPGWINPFFFLDFVKNKTKRISYAASMGTLEIPDNKQEEFLQLVKNFDSISVREKDMVYVISEYTDKNISVNIDPTFLLSAEEWREYQKEYPIKKPYILVFPLYWDVKLNKKLKELSKKTGLKVVAICMGLSKIFAHKKLYDVDPGEFLWLIDNAEYVVTSSFHGTAFSTIFNKQFAAVVNPNAPSRIGCLAEALNIPLVSIDNLCDNKFRIKYEDINQNILKERENSINYLTRELNVEK